MADVFGDLDLFSEFEKDREAQGSFIHYDEENVRSRIIFEDFKSESEDESEDETEPVAPTQPCVDQSVFESDALKSSSDPDLASESIELKKEVASEDGELVEGLVKNVDNSGDSVAGELNRKYDQDVKAPKPSSENEKKVAWLNAQLYAEAAEEANKQNKSAQQLIYERILALLKSELE